MNLPLTLGCEEADSEKDAVMGRHRLGLLVSLTRKMSAVPERCHI